MSEKSDPAPERVALIYRHHEQLYRLALLVTGDVPAAAALVERAYRALDYQQGDPEAALIRALLPWRPSRRRPYRAPSTGTAPPEARGLIRILAGLSPSERLAIGLRYLYGMAGEEIAVVLAGAPEVPDPALTLARFRLDAARALDLLPVEIDAALALALDRGLEGRLPDDEAAVLRRMLFERSEVRDARDGLAEARDLLARALPALFAVPPPPGFVERLLEVIQGRSRPPAPEHRVTRARAGLALGVLALAMAIVLLPSLWTRRGVETSGPRSAVELIDAAIARFDRAPLQRGVLHEQYRVEVDGTVYLIERWHDYAPPHRLYVAVEIEGREGPPLLEIGSDGRSLIQYRYGPGDRLFVPQRPVDAHISEAEARTVLPLLRTVPTARVYGQGALDMLDRAPRILAQARAASPAFLGRTTFLDREAFLLSYRAVQEQEQPARMLLTIDAQTYALLDVTILAEGAEESSARHLLRAQTIEVLPQVPDARFKLPGVEGLISRAGLPSVHWPDLPDEQLVTLADAQRRATYALLAPRQLPDATMRGVAVLGNGQAGEEVALVYEGVLQTMLVLPGNRFDRNNASGEERDAGAFRYRILRSIAGSLDAQATSVVAEIYPREAPDQRRVIVLIGEYASAVEREGALAQVIASLTPVTEQSLPALERSFYRPQAAGGTR